MLRFLHLFLGPTYHIRTAQRSYYETVKRMSDQLLTFNRLIDVKQMFLFKVRSNLLK